MKTRTIPVAIASAVLGGAIVYVYSSMTMPDVSKLEHAMRQIEAKYLQPPDRTALIDGAIEGMLESLDDPYTTYMDQEEAKAFLQHISASFEGIGATMEEVDGRVVIVAPIKGSPAEEAGIRPGDIVLKVGDTSLEGKKVHEAVLLIRGKKGTKAELTILRDGKEVQVSIVRDTIPIETVYAELREDGVGVIRLASFAETTSAEYEKAVRSLLDQGMKALVLDLRQNPGGLTNIAEDIAETIVPDGEPIVQFKRRGAATLTTYAEHRDIGLDGLPKAVLIDEGSASASEIVAAALRTSGKVPLVGVKSFGKGTAQVSESFPDGSSMKYTVAEWLGPKGEQIDKAGLEPDVRVELPAYASLPLIDLEQTMKENEFSDDIKVVQTMLKAAGYDPGREDGFFDERTKNEVVRFQEAKGIEASGVVASETIRELIAEVRKAIEANDTQLEKAVELVKEKIEKID
ncbi:S41 family peptidase [Paenibacillus sp. TRM 82003]|nr:S41 family peptidase [Paenibacillus sp. TRM 82003]